MFARLMKLWMIVVSAALLAPVAASAQEPPLGDPIPPDLPPWIEPVDNSARTLIARAADPDGGPPWAFGIWTARIPLLAPDPFLCNTIGRVAHRRLGRLDAAGVFHPYLRGIASGFFCTSVDAGTSYPGGYPSMFGVDATTAFIPSSPCNPAFPVPPNPQCDPAITRTVRKALLGRGIIDATIELGGVAREVPVTPSGELLVVLRGTGPGVGDAPIRVRFHACGPLARPDLIAGGFSEVTVRDCIGTLLLAVDIPGPPSQAVDSAPGVITLSSDQLPAISGAGLR